MKAQEIDHPSSLVRSWCATVEFSSVSSPKNNLARQMTKIPLSPWQPSL